MSLALLGHGSCTTTSCIQNAPHHPIICGGFIAAARSLDVEPLHAQSAITTAADAPPNPRLTMSTALPTIAGAGILSHTLSL
ncbi:hypothetical protein [Komagataeibacter medellinensis]|uniref:hypothetical protein n=1 Tax=Komagataeibacter medellinensis TaxID=1177712 RepID=UPI001297E7F2|nr:hypothetical protein [Komagataeibacter medellinensis]